VLRLSFLCGVSCLFVSRGVKSYELVEYLKNICCIWQGIEACEEPWAVVESIEEHSAVVETVEDFSSIVETVEDFSAVVESIEDSSASS